MPDHRTAGDAINSAPGRDAQLVVLCVLTGKETETAAEQNQSVFIENGKEEKVPGNGILRRGDFIPAVFEVAEEKSADPVILYVSHRENVAEWLSVRRSGSWKRR